MGLGHIPRNRQQVKVWQGVELATKEGTLKCQVLGDPWYMLLNECKIQGRDPKTAFVRDVRVGAASWEQTGS